MTNSQETGTGKNPFSSISSVGMETGVYPTDLSRPRLFLSQGFKSPSPQPSPGNLLSVGEEHVLGGSACVRQHPAWMSVQQSSMGQTEA